MEREPEERERSEKKRKTHDVRRGERDRRRDGREGSEKRWKRGIGEGFRQWRWLMEIETAIVLLNTKNPKSKGDKRSRRLSCGLKNDGADDGVCSQ
ncbi:hypothetical protein HanRHA438_Chr16g0764041 [Helianthus annuus]|nr:hypothetical protein HanRHA438_Chr16g0764041 [Helianthus annuus]